MAKRPKPVHQMPEGQFETMFPAGDEDACKRYLAARRWPNGVHCPRCGSSQTERLSAFGSTACKSLYRCIACREPFEHFKPI